MLRFPLFGIPVGVHVSFLLIALFGTGVYSGTELVLWTAAAFTSILMHEMGHALTARAFGATKVDVMLFGLGGVTTYSHGSAMSHGRLFLVSAAGSFVGIVSGGAVLIAARMGVISGVPDAAAVYLESFIFTALVWGVLNWVPIVPFDGGHMVEHIASMANPEKAPLIGQVVTWITVAIVVPIALKMGAQFAAIIVVVFAFNGLRDYRRRTKRASEPSSLWSGRGHDTQQDTENSQERQPPQEFPI